MKDNLLLTGTIGIADIPFITDYVNARYILVKQSTDKWLNSQCKNKINR